MAFERRTARGAERACIVEQTLQLNPITTVRNNGYLFVPAVRPLVAKPLAP